MMSNLMQLLLGIVVMVVTAGVVLFGRSVIEAVIENQRRGRR